MTTTKLLTLERAREAMRRGLRGSTFMDWYIHARRYARADRPEDAQSCARQALEYYAEFPELFPAIDERILRQTRAMAETGKDL